MPQAPFIYASAEFFPDYMGEYGSRGRFPFKTLMRDGWPLSIRSFDAVRVFAPEVLRLWLEAGSPLGHPEIAATLAASRSQSGGRTHPGNLRAVGAAVDLERVATAPIESAS